MHRQMVYWHPTLGQSTLDYNLYLDPLRAQVWGDPYPNSYSTGAKLFFWEATLDIYGRIPAEQDVPARYLHRHDHGQYQLLSLATSSGKRLPAGLPSVVGPTDRAAPRFEFV